MCYIHLNGTMVSMSMRSHSARDFTWCARPAPPALTWRARPPSLGALARRPRSNLERAPALPTWRARQLSLGARSRSPPTPQLSLGARARSRRARSHLEPAPALTRRARSHIAPRSHLEPAPALTRRARSHPARPLSPGAPALTRRPALFTISFATNRCACALSFATIVRNKCV